jgi:hypothetical protein
MPLPSANALPIAESTSVTAAKNVRSLCVMVSTASGPQRPDTAKGDRLDRRTPWIENWQGSASPRFPDGQCGHNACVAADVADEVAKMVDRIAVRAATPSAQR